MLTLRGREGPNWLAASAVTVEILSISSMLAGDAGNGKREVQGASKDEKDDGVTSMISRLHTAKEKERRGEE